MTTAFGQSDRSSVRVAADAVQLLRTGHPLRVAVDGRTASGKTTFADLLAAELRLRGRDAIRASIDGFHHPSAIRHRQGRLSPDGYYEDGRNIEAVRRLILDPLGPGGNGTYAVATFDLQRDQPLEPVFHAASENAVLIVDGTFLQRPELRSAWDFVIFLDVTEEEARRRGVARDSEGLGGQVRASELYERRYCPAFTRYAAECSPIDNADLVIENG